MCSLSAKRLSARRSLAKGVLDIFHALQHISETGKVLHARAEQSARWCAEARDILLAHGWEGIKEYVRRDFECLTDLEQRSINGLLDYLALHQHHINYAGRLGAGLSIGSGQIDGACKNLIGRRINAGATRWKVRRANRMTGLCCIMDTDHWKTYWQTT